MAMKMPERSEKERVNLLYEKIVLLESTLDVMRESFDQMQKTVNRLQKEIELNRNEDGLVPYTPKARKQTTNSQTQ